MSSRATAFGTAGWAARPDRVQVRGHCATHAVIVSGKIIRLDHGAANDRRVGGASAALTHMPGYSRPPYQVGGAYPAGWLRLAHKYAAAIVRCGR